jgi:hypothetical protein
MDKHKQACPFVFQTYPLPLLSHRQSPKRDLERTRRKPDGIYRIEIPLKALEINMATWIKERGKPSLPLLFSTPPSVTSFELATLVSLGFQAKRD